MTFREKKENFITLIFGILGGMLFGLGMCMCMLSEWDLFREGILVGIVGILLLVCLIPLCKGLK